MGAPLVQLDRREAVKTILRDRGDALVVTGLGSPTWDVASAGDSPLNFYLWGAMGGAAMLGLGLALAQRQRRVLVVTGDGEMLMGLGSLATIGPERPRNLSIVILDNERYGETGMQPSHTARGVDLAAIARGAAFPFVATVSTRQQLDEWLPTLHGPAGPVLTVVKVRQDEAPARVPLRDGPSIKNRFREALLGPEAIE
jgi:thiamine pyrophosphate-dependent acetolactate synthase large subunit-like protein